MKFMYQVRSIRLQMFLKISVLNNFAKLTGKHLCQNLFFNKVAGLRPATFLQKRLWHRCFPVNFAKFVGAFFFRTTPVAASGQGSALLALLTKGFSFTI